MQVLNKNKHRTLIGLIENFENIKSIRKNYNEPAQILVNSEWINSTCVRCINPKCIRYDDTEIRCNAFPDFAYDRNYAVCSVDAISWNFESELPEIDHAKCIDCGLCANRCVAGAIFSKNNKCYIAKSDNANKISDENILAHKQLLEKLESIEWNNIYKLESETVFDDLYKVFASLDGRSMVPNLLVRNIMIGLGCESSNSRAGDVYTRIDAVYSKDKIGWLFNDKGAIEVEFGRDTLEACRSILDDIAVLHTRSGLDKVDNDALVVCLSLPNKRQGYFQVIKDINRVLNLKIQTISIGVLLIMLWNDVDVRFGDKSFYMDFDNMSIRNALIDLLGRDVDIREGYLGILEPNK